MPSVDEPGEGPASTAKEVRMRDPSATRVDHSRIHRLLRSLVGVADVSLIVTPDGKLRSVAVLRDGHVQEHQLARNVVSGLKAGFGLRLQPADVQVVLDVAAWQQRAAAEAERRVASEPAQAAPAQASPIGPLANGAVHTNGNGKHASGNGNGNLASRPHGNGAAGLRRVRPVPVRVIKPVELQATPRPVTEPARVSSTDQEPRLEGIDVERQGATLRCRVSVRVGERTYAAIAEVRDAPTAEAELAARVTLDALRAGGLTTARLDGVSLTMIGDVVYLVAAVRTASATAARASAAPLVRTMAEAAAAAVLRAHGPIGFGEPRAALNGTI